MDDSGFGLHKVGQIFMPATELARAVRFYRETLGMEFLFEVPRMAFFALDGVRLMLGEREDGSEHPGSILYYKVPDIVEAHRVLGARGVTFELDPTLIADMEDHELWMAFFIDSEGNQLALMSEIPKAQTT
ncbi:MAG: VOC family protein [Gemmatimonadetes bacterium]|nr:VOC family protein [Gemmatimonadota bacterium]MDA1103698.1 VOC family protein [Gemmatimonadota bacterium]